MGSWNTGKGLWDMGQGTRDTSSINRGGGLWSGMCSGRKWVATMGDLAVKPPTHINNIGETQLSVNVHTPPTNMLTLEMYGENLHCAPKTSNGPEQQPTRQNTEAKLTTATVRRVYKRAGAVPSFLNSSATRAYGLWNSEGNKQLCITVFVK